MGLTVTVAELITRARQHANMEGSQFVSDDEVTFLLDRAYRELYDLVVQSYENYFLSSSVFVLVPGTDTYALPTDFYKAMGVDYDTGDNTISLTPFVFQERNRFRGAQTAAGAGLQYQVQASNLKFAPVPSTAVSITLWYIPVPTRLTSASTFDTVNGWDDYVVLDAAEKMLAKEESDTSAVANMKAQSMDRINKASVNRDVGLPERIADVSNTQFTPWMTRR